MNIGVSALVTNESNEILLIQRDDTRTWSPPGGSLELRESPISGVEREVKEETGLEVKATQLTSVIFAKLGTRSSLHFNFRCSFQGGELQTSDESLQVSFAKANPIDLPMLPMHKERIEIGLKHVGNSPELATYTANTRERLLAAVVYNVVYPIKNLVRQLRGGGKYVPPPQWKTTVLCIVRNSAGEILWTRPLNQQNENTWKLVGGQVASNQAPWDGIHSDIKMQTGLDIQLSELGGVYTNAEGAELILVFSVQIKDATLPTQKEEAEFQYLGLEGQVENIFPEHYNFAVDSLSLKRHSTVFKEI